MAALAAAGAAPPPLEAFNASAGETGAILEWRRPQPDGRTYFIDIKMRDLSAAPSHRGSAPGAHLLTDKGRHPQAAKPGQSPREDIHLRAAETQKASDSAPGDELAGAVDPTAKMGETYTYVAERVRSVSVGGHLLEIHSEPTPVMTLAMRDTFPPRSPFGLAAIPSVAREQGSQPPASHDGATGKPYIDLSWEPNTEPDLAGYIVYRQLARPNGDRQGPLARLTPLPISAPAYRDMAVTPGQRYIYSVTAVDASGNESAPSAQAQEVIQSPN